VGTDLFPGGGLFLEGDFFPGGPTLEANAMASDCWTPTSLYDCLGSPESTSSFETSFTDASPSPVSFSFATPDTALSPSPVVSPGAPHHGTTVCKWSNCGAVIDTHLLVAHFEFAHAKDIPSTADTKEPCQWAGCTHSSRYLRRHAGLHFGRDVSCDACGDAFTRQDAVTRHKKRGTCKQCAWCKARFETVAEKVAHSAQCSKRGKAVRSGRPREVVKVGKAHRHAHPYLC
jgi:hypothetical protein